MPEVQENRKGGEQMKGKSAYVGRIKNTGSMYVKAPVDQGNGGKKPTIKTGGDLRAKKGK